MTEQRTSPEQRQALRHALYHATPGQWAAEVSRWEEDGRQYSYTTGITPILKGMTWQGREHEPAANVDAIVGLHNAASDLLDDADALAAALKVNAELVEATRYLSAALVDVRDNLAEYAETKSERLGAARQAYRRATEALEEYDDDL